MSSPDALSAGEPASQLIASRPLPPEQRTLALTTYRSAKVPEPDSVQESTWASLLERFRSHAVRPAKGGAAFSFLRLKPGTTRANENVESHSAVVLDIDDGTPLQQIVDQVREYEFLAVSTHSHSQKHAKYRMIFPLSRDVPPERWPQIWQLTNQLIGGHADPATKDNARIYYFPTCPVERKNDAFFHHNPGKWLDPDELLTPRAVPGNDMTRAARSTVKGLNWEFEVRYLYPAVSAHCIAENCEQVRQMRDLGGRISEPRWYASLGVLAHTENGDEVAHEWSAGDPRYTYDETEGRLARLRRDEIGPTTCGRFADLYPDGCANCKYKGKIKSPIQLGHVQSIAPDDSQSSAKAPNKPVSSAPIVSPPQVVTGTMAAPQAAPYQAHAAAFAFGAPASVEPLFDIESARAGRFIHTLPTPRVWLLKDCLPAGVVGGLVAAGGAGKTQAVLQLCVAVAAGLPFCDTWNTGAPGEVLALLAEDDEAEIHRRLYHIVRYFCHAHPNSNVEAIVAQNLYVKSVVAENNLLTALAFNREVQQTDRVARIVATARPLKNLKLIILDPVSRFRGGVENSAEDVTRFIEALERIRTAFPSATVLVVHHTNKWSGQNEEQSQGAARGSSAFSDGIRWQMNLAGLNTKEAARVPAAERHMYLSATITKNNYAPPQATVYLKRADGGVLTKSSLEDAAGKKVGNIMLQIVARILDSEPMSADTFEAEFGGKTNVFGVGKVSLRGHIKQAIDAGYLTKTETGREKHLVVTDNGRAALSVMRAATAKNPR